MYRSLKAVLFQSKVIGTDDAGVKVLDETLLFGPHRAHPAVFPQPEHPVTVYDLHSHAGTEEQ